MARTVSDVGSPLRRAADLLRRRGLAHVLWRVARRLSAPVVDLCWVTCFVHELDREPSAQADGAFRVRLATPADLPLVLEASDPRRTAAMLGRRFERGDRCFLALDAQGRAVHSRWLSTERGYIPELHMDVALRPGEAYFYDGYTRADHRGKGADSAVRRFIFGWLRAAGCARAYSYVRGDNPVGQRAAARWQAPTGTVGALRLLSLTPLVFGHRRVARPLLVRRNGAQGDEGDDARRARVTRAWFESWCREPLAKRSTGFHAVPDEYFAATAAYVTGTLELDAGADLVLDVGCDSAMVSRLVARSCRQLVGVDFVPGLLVDVPSSGESGASRRGTYAAGDARFLPFRSHAFDKVYSAAMIHVLPSRDDGWLAIAEMIRVCRPGGKVLVASVPDAGKRRRALADAWRRAGPVGKLELALALLTPKPVKRIWHNLTGAGWDDRIILLDYDLGTLTARLTARGHRCRVLDFPADYWSRDFRRTRSNLVIEVAPTGAAGDPQPDALASGHGTRH